MVVEYGSSVSLILIMHFLRYETSNDASTPNLSQQLHVFALHFFLRGSNSFCLLIAHFLVYFFFLFTFFPRFKMWSKKDNWHVHTFYTQQASWWTCTLCIVYDVFYCIFECFCNGAWNSLFRDDHSNERLAMLQDVRASYVVLCFRIRITTICYEKI